jgi:hypothetical protein
MADYYSNFAMTFDPGVANILRALDIYQALFDEHANTDDAISFNLQRDGNVLWIEDELSSDLDGVVRYIQKCAEEFGLKGRWAFEWSNTSSRPGPDAYGGGVVLFDFDQHFVQWIPTHVILNKWIAGQSLTEILKEDAV